MIASDVVGPWWNVTLTDEEGQPYQGMRRLPQFIHDIGDNIPWRDVTAQTSEQIPPVPGLAVWRVWCTAEQLAQFVALPAYDVLRSAEVEAQQQDPPGWPARAAANGTGNAAFPTLPASGWLEAGSIYLGGGQAWIVRQSHHRTEHAPDAVPALFMVYRADANELLEWVAGEPVQIGTRRTHGGKIYEAVQAHVTQADWTPVAAPALWREVVEPPPTGAWAVGVAYNIGDEVTYNGHTYKCLQAHTSQAGWTPSAVPALWQLLS